MITPISLGAEHSDIGNQARIRRRALDRRVRRLRQQMRCAIRIQREDAIISYLSARRFPPRSKEALILRLLAQTALHRTRKLEALLSRLSATPNYKTKRWLFDWRRFYVSYAPRSWLLLWHKRHNG
jgi:hypothetical protein